jgi:glycosyltransferase involved in cell wall biosynthesis
MSPIGVCAEMGIPNETHFLAETENDWEAKLVLLLKDTNLRRRMGAAGRKLALKEYSLEIQAGKLAQILREVAG